MQPGLIASILYIAVLCTQQLANGSPASLRPEDQSTEPDHVTEQIMLQTAGYSVTTRDAEQEHPASSSSSLLVVSSSSPAAAVVCGSDRGNVTTLSPEWLSGSTCYRSSHTAINVPASLLPQNTECQEEQWQEHLRSLTQELNDSLPKFSFVMKAIENKTKRNCFECSNEEEEIDSLTTHILGYETGLTGRSNATSASNRTAKEALEIVYFRLSAAATIFQNLQNLETKFNEIRRDQDNSVPANLTEALRVLRFQLMCNFDVDAFAKCEHSDVCVARPEILPANFTQLVRFNRDNRRITRTNCQRCHFPIMARVVLKLFERSIQEAKEHAEGQMSIAPTEKWTQNATTSD